MVNITSTNNQLRDCGFGEVLHIFHRVFHRFIGAAAEKLVENKEFREKICRFPQKPEKPTGEMWKRNAKWMVSIIRV